MGENLPIIGITMGDPCGIGPEIAVKALTSEEVYSTCCPLLIGDVKFAEKAIAYCGKNYKLNVIGTPSEAAGKFGIIDVVDVPSDFENCLPGKICRAGGRSAFDSINRSIELATLKNIDAVATAPINKEALKAADVDYIGHTEIFAGLTGAIDPLTMFQVKNLRVFFLSRHVSLKTACDMVTEERVFNYILRCKDALDGLGVTAGTMAVAGLNPHCGEHGLFGDEEVISIEPAVKKACSLGCDVEGPISADSVFHLALKGRYNSVLSLYHDQGHIATKTLDFERTVSVTAGLPFLRTSVDHGTAFDIAWQGVASEVSMKEAILLAATYCRQTKIRLS
ncbi:MAG: 4-hydroxythreonine-4-phosphate dehydrogenase PdxA [Clostridiales bacterium]|jgi:4-hydroxythreonine-4-phosphate dehydrogenase|nr:4-hydroxythreonine-4-phosphate dehydrogenase PdxA [Clostridiales bacterium]